MPKLPDGAGLVAVVAALVAVTAQHTGAGGGPTFLGPTPYLSAADSPFALEGGNYCFEDFEDGVFDVPHVTGDGTQIIFPAGNADSVDADDGVIDGDGNGGHSYFGAFGSVGITFTFDDMAPGGLPTEVGVVWTDGLGEVTFEAFGPGMVSLGTLGPFDHPDGVTNGTTAEDRFYGVVDASGIAAVKLTNTSGGIEVDHLQYEYPGCQPGSSTTTTTSSTSSSTVTTTSLSTSSSSTSTTTSTTTTTTPPTTTTTTSITSTTSTTLAGVSFPPGKKLLVKRKKSGAHRLQMIVKDPGIAAAGPCEQDGELVVESVGAGTGVRRFALEAAFWKPIRASKPEKGCKYRKGPIVATVQIKTGKLLRAVANGEDLGVPLGTDPSPVRVEIRHGSLRHCLEFGGTKGQHKPYKKLLAKDALPATGCPSDP